MNKQINFTLAIVVLVIITGIIIGIIWFSCKKQDQQTNQVAFQSAEKKTPSVEIANFETYQNKDYGFEFQYPQNWRKSEMEDFFLSDPEVNVLQLDFKKVSATTSVFVFVDNLIKQRDCDGDHIIEETDNGVYYVEFCSSGTESYHYATKLNNDLILDFSYKEDFEDNWTIDKKISTLKQIISTLKVKK